MATVTISVDGTGATDVTAAIQSAVDGSATGDSIYLPAGDYKISDFIALPAKRTFYGDGYGTRFLGVAGSFTGVVIGSRTVYGVIGAVGDVDHVRMRNFRIDLQTNASAVNGLIIADDGAPETPGNPPTFWGVDDVWIDGNGTGQYLCWVNRANEGDITALYMDGHSTPGANAQEGLEFYGGNHVRIARCHATNIGSSAFFAFEDGVEGSGTEIGDLSFDQIESHDVGTGMRITCETVAKSITVSNFNIKGATSRGLYVASSPTGAFKGLRVHNGQIRDCENFGWWIGGQGSTAWESSVVEGVSVYDMVSGAAMVQDVTRGVASFRNVYDGSGTVSIVGTQHGNTRLH